MKPHDVTLFLIGMMIATVSAQGGYNCNWYDEGCKNGGTCNSDGTCTCVSGDHYNCLYDNSPGNQCTDLTCENGGQCVLDNAASVCACPYGFFGATCQTEKANIECLASTATFKMTFPPDFVGTVQVRSEQEVTDAACIPAEGTTDGLKDYTVTFDLTGGTTNCPLTHLTAVTDGQDTSYSAQLFVRYLGEITAQFDEIYNLTCRHAGESVEIYKDIQNVGLTDTDVTFNNKSVKFSPVDLVLTKDGVEFGADTALVVGDTFVVRAYVTDDTGTFLGVRIENCVANNTLAGDQSKTYAVFENGCPTVRGKATTAEQVDGTVNVNGNTRPTKDVTIRAFKFRDSQQIGLVCTAKVCKVAADCAAPPDCAAVRAAAAVAPTDPAPTDPAATESAATEGATDGTGPTDAAPTDAAPTDGPTSDGGVVRRKRAADDQEEKQTTFSATFRVLNPGETLEITGEEEKSVADVSSCLAHSAIITVLSILGAVILILFIASFVMAIILMRRRQTKEIDVVPSGRFQIPRAHVNAAYNAF